MSGPEQQEDVSWPEDAIEVGRILGAWGIKGGIKVLPFAADPQALFSARRWFLKPAEASKKPSAAAVSRPLKPGQVVATPAHKTPAQKAALAAPLPFALNVQGVRDQGDAIVATAPEIADRDAAEAMKGARVFVSRSTFPQTGDGEFYWIDLIGLSVFNREQVALGDVVGLIDTGPHCVLRVQPADAEAEERLIPFVEAFVDSVDMPGRKILVDWGLDY